MSSRDERVAALAPLREAIQAALDMDLDMSTDTEYARGVAEVLAHAFLPIGNTIVAKEMIMAALTSKEW